MWQASRPLLAAAACLLALGAEASSSSAPPPASLLEAESETQGAASSELQEIRLGETSREILNTAFEQGREVGFDEAETVHSLQDWSLGLNEVRTSKERQARAIRRSRRAGFKEGLLAAKKAWHLPGTAE